MSKNKAVETLSFDTIMSDIFYCIKVITGKNKLPESIFYTWGDDAKHSEINQEVLDKSDDILFLKPEQHNIILYKRLNYLITLAIAKKLVPNVLDDYIKNKVTFEYLEEQLPLMVDSDMIDIDYKELVLDYDSIKVLPDNDELENHKDDYQSEGKVDFFLLGLNYINHLYDPKNNKYNSKAVLNLLLDLFDEVLLRAAENGEVNLTFKKDMIFRYYIHSDDDNIHIMFNVDMISKNVTVLNPATKEPMTIDIYKPWWRLDSPVDDDSNSLKIQKNKRDSNANPDSFESIALSQIELYKKKNSDYGSATDKLFQKHGFKYYQIMLEQKMQRIDSLTKKDNQHNFESLEDTLLDLSNYAILAVESLRKQKKQND